MAVSCLAVFAVVGCRSTIASALFPSHDGSPVQAATPSATTGASATEATPSTANVATTTASALAPSAAAPTRSTTPPQSQPGSLTDVAQALLAQINAWRAADSKAPLTMTSGLVAS